MSADVYRILARWVPRGAMIKDCLEVVLYDGSDDDDASDTIEHMVEWARTSAGDGVVVIDAYDNNGWVGMRQAHVGDAWASAAPRQIGYPAHDCGRPMMPADVAGSRERPKDRLYCAGCGEFVTATPEQRMRANVAAKHDREAAR